jgi:hypothetical protein
LSFCEGELTVQVPDGPWRTQLLSLTSNYLQQLRDITDGRVQQLRFVLASEAEKR